MSSRCPDQRIYYLPPRGGPPRAYVDAGGPWYASHAEGLASNLGGAACWLGVGWWLWRRGIFVKL